MPARSCRQSAGAARWARARLLGAGGVAVAVHDVTTQPGAFEAVVALGCRSLPIPVRPDWSPAAGADATGMARHLDGAPVPPRGHVRRPQIREEQS